MAWKTEEQTPMLSGRRAKVLIAITTGTIAVIVAASLHVRTLLQGGRSESVLLVSLALTCLLLSWLLGVLSQNGREERHGIKASDITLSAPLSNKISAPPCRSSITNAFSIDLEDYYHTEVAGQAVSWSEWDDMPSRLEIVMPRLLDLLDTHNTKATIFVLGWLARKYPGIVRAAAQRGHEIACHSYRHRVVFRLDRSTFYEDTHEAKAAIEDAIGVPVLGYRAPCFSITPGTEWAFEVLAELGFQYDSSVNPVWHTLYGNARGLRFPHYVANNRLLEIPIAVWRVWGINLPIGGGAYLRLLPYSYSKTGLQHLNARNHAAGAIYMHPWEIDDHQPRLRLPWVSQIRQTWGTGAMESKVDRLLSSFDFAPIAEVYSHAFAPESAYSTLSAQSRAPVGAEM
jgi:polysaccharide deacetylase family protein (PEP-CTERM system associated)